MIDPEIVGYIAAILITVAYMPQTVKVLRTRDTHSISLGMFTLTTSGAACWFWYGYLLGSWPIMLCNGITFITSGIILLMKIRCG